MGLERMRRILVVDDDPLICAMLRDVLEDEGYLVQTAGDGQAALESIGATEPDLLITDVMMPGLAGWSLLPRARQRFPMLPVLLISAIDPGPGLASRDPLLRPPTLFLAKPFALEELLAIVARLTSGDRDHAGS